MTFIELLVSEFAGLIAVGLGILWFRRGLMPTNSERPLQGPNQVESPFDSSACDDKSDIFKDGIIHLPWGIAFFDTHLRLITANPAFFRLTGLDPRISLENAPIKLLLDQLRNNRTLPEPKNYRAWRHGFLSSLTTTQGLCFRERWFSQDGRTLLVEARRSGSGTITLSVNDVTSETERLRRFVIEAKINQSILDKIDLPVAVFLPGGLLDFTNTAYQAFWQSGADDPVLPPRIEECLELWCDSARDPSVASRIRRFVLEPDTNAEFSESVVTDNGRMYRFRVVHLADGASMVIFDDSLQTVTHTHIAA